METIYDFIIVGSGPIGASAAYFLSQEANGKTIAVVTQDPSDEISSTYRFAGGSIRWQWADPVMTEMTTVTANFVKKLLNEGVDLSAIEDHYQLIHRGMFIPSLNISSGKLVEYLLTHAKAQGVVVHEHTKLEKIGKNGMLHELHTSKGIFIGKKVFLALGASLHQFIPDVPVAFTKRQLFVLDVPITPERREFPHTVIPLGPGLIFIFLKKIGEGYKMLLGQEDIFEYSSQRQEENRYQELIDLGLFKLMPFLKDAKVEKILWAFDYEKKFPYFHAQDDGLQAAVCGSAVRSCIYIGKEAAKRLTT